MTTWTKCMYWHFENEKRNVNHHLLFNFDNFSVSFAFPFCQSFVNAIFYNSNLVSKLNSVATV